MRGAVIGGGINGVFCAWRLSERGHSVDLFEAQKVMCQTSSNSSKLLHGGIRYLEQGHFGLVREALSDRAWWMTAAPDVTRPIEIAMPVYKSSKRGRFTLFAGALLYGMLAGKLSLGKPRLLSAKKSSNAFGELKAKNLSGVVTFYDGQMNEELLGAWVVKQARDAGVEIHEDTPVQSFDPSGRVVISTDSTKNYDFIINATGPWAAYLNDQNNVKTNYTLTLIRGSHLLLDYRVKHSYLFQDPTSQRVVYVLDYFGKTLVGTTEVLQETYESPHCSDEERDFLIGIFNHHFKHQITQSDVVREYAGLRPILCRNKESRADNYSKASRESEIEITDRLITIYGGKWTSAPSLATKVEKQIRELRV